MRGGGGLYLADWNAGTWCGASQREGIDDIAFLSAIIRESRPHLPINAHRVYAAGFSSGALLAYHAACRLAPTLAAVAVVEGSLADDHCAPARPLPLLAIQGTADQSVRDDDPALTPAPRAIPAGATALPPSVQFWAAANSCRSVVARQLSPSVRQTRLTACATPGADVMLYAITGGLHGWPGEAEGLGAAAPVGELSPTAVITASFDQPMGP